MGGRNNITDKKKQPLLGTNIFDSSDGPRYIKGMSICAAFTFLVTFLALALRTLLVWENRKLDEKYGYRVKRINRRQGEERGEENAVSEENYGPQFRYVL